MGTEQPDKRKTPGVEFQVTFLEAPSILVSLFRQVRDRFPGRRVSSSSRHHSGQFPIRETPPWYLDIPNRIRALFEQPPAPVQIDSAPITGGVIWRDYQPQAASWVNSLLAHILALTVLVFPFAVTRLPERTQTLFKPGSITIHLPPLPSSRMRAGGGGGGDRSTTPASQGAIPKFALLQLAPPVAELSILTPQLPVEPSLLGPPDLKLPQMKGSDTWGDPHGLLGPLSNGQGCCGGIGSGPGTGIGPGEGPGYGPGRNGGTGDDDVIYGVGRNVTAPVPIYKPEPAYSEQARKAKLQGTVTLWVVISPEGKVTDMRVVKPLGLGLDEEAVNTVRTWKFIPGKRNGVPVPVRVIVEVSFRLF